MHSRNDKIVFLRKMQRLKDLQLLFGNSCKKHTTPKRGEATDDVRKTLSYCYCRVCGRQRKYLEDGTWDQKRAGVASNTRMEKECSGDYSDRPAGLTCETMSPLESSLKIAYICLKMKMCNQFWTWTFSGFLSEAVCCHTQDSSDPVLKTAICVFRQERWMKNRDTNTAFSTGSNRLESRQCSVEM